jgi:hypothetical protein
VVDTSSATFDEAAARIVNALRPSPQSKRSKPR